MKHHPIFEKLLVALMLPALVAGPALAEVPVSAMGNVAVDTLPERLIFEGQAQVDEVFNSLHGGSEPHQAYARVITDNVEAWWARWLILERAQKSIDVTYFIVEPDIFGKSLIGMLLKKAKEGVRIRMMVDARGTKALSRMFLGQDYLQELVQHENVEVRVYNPWHQGILHVLRNIRHAIASNHDKLIIVDGEWLITGGRNISKSYFVHPEDDPKGYRDTDVILRGARVAAEAQQAFEEEFDGLRHYNVGKDWLGNWDDQNFELEYARRAMRRWMSSGKVWDPEKFDNSALMQDLNEELQKYPHTVGIDSYEPFRGETPYDVKLLDKHSMAGDRNDITGNLVRFIDACEKEVMIQNPYVIFTKKARGALQRASDRGVPIILVTNSPDSTDSLLTQAMFIKEWKNNLKNMKTMRIFAYKGPNKLHAKVFVFDGRVTGIGTYNMDPMSEQINSEEIAFIRKPEFGQRNRLRIMNDIRNSVEYRIKVEADGSVKQDVGPSDHVTSKAFELIKTLGSFSFLRSLF